MSPIDRTLQAGDGTPLHAVEYRPVGEARLAIICLPGLTRNARDFDTLAPRLAATHRVICPDFRGRGASGYAVDPMSYIPQSYVDDLAALIVSLELTAAVLIGTSLGALVAILFTAMRPEWVLGLVLNDSGPEIDPRGLARIGGYVGKAPPVTDWRDAALAARLQDAVVFPDYAPDDWMRVARRRFAEDEAGIPRLDYDPAIAIPFSSPATTPDQWPFFRQLRGIPTLVLRGAQSDILSQESLAKMRGAVPEIECVEVPDRGHAPALDEPAALAAIDRLLVRLPDRIGRLEWLRRHLGARRFAPCARWAGFVPPLL